ncbi:MAG: zinc ribbon domain-containing protein [Verrucomicrobiota bacterium]
MPLYEYLCPSCGLFSDHRLVAERDKAMVCPDCRCVAVRVISAPNLALMPPGQRRAHARNEQSQHAPAVQQRHRCSSGCGCGARQKPRSARSSENKPKYERARAGQRPWMLGH